MSFVLLAVGLMAAAIGLVTIGFGIPINAFSLGNTLIISGTIAVATRLDPDWAGAGAGSIAADRRSAQEPAAGPRRIRRIGEARRRSPRRIAAPGAPIPAPCRERRSRPPEPPRMPEPRAPEPRFPATASEPAPGPLDWLRAKSKPTASPRHACMPAVPPPPDGGTADGRDDRRGAAVAASAAASGDAARCEPARAEGLVAQPRGRPRSGCD